MSRSVRDTILERSYSHGRRQGDSQRRSRSSRSSSRWRDRRSTTSRKEPATRSSFCTATRHRRTSGEIIVPYAAEVGRAIAPDLIGMGKSDKPDIEYRFFDHVRYIEGFIERLGLQNITLVIHDWGTGLGFHYSSRHEGNTKGVAFMEAILPMSWDAFPEAGRDMFKSFRTKDVGEDMLINKNMFVENVLPGFVVRTLTDEEMDHYRAPYKEEAARKPLWRWPNELPIDGEPADVWEAAVAYHEWLQRTEVPKILFHAAAWRADDGSGGGVANIEAEGPEDGEHWPRPALRAGGQPVQDRGGAGEMVSGSVMRRSDRLSRAADC